MRRWNFILSLQVVFLGLLTEVLYFCTNMGARIGVRLDFADLEHSRINGCTQQRSMFPFLSSYLSILIDQKVNCQSYSPIHSGAVN